MKTQSPDAKVRCPKFRVHCPDGSILTVAAEAYQLAEDGGLVLRSSSGQAVACFRHWNSFLFIEKEDEIA